MPTLCWHALWAPLFFFLLDFIHGYWQFGLHHLSQECLSFITPFGVFTPTRVPHGAMNSVAYFQSSMESLFNHLDLLIWLDDILGYATTYTELLDKLESTLQICASKGLKLHPAKCELATKEVKFCGRLIDKNGVRFNPRNYAALVNMPKPVTVGALMELVHGANWMRSAIPRFAELIEPLQKLLEEHYKLHKSRKKSRVYNRPLSSWGDQEDTTFQCLIQAIATQVKLAIPNPAKRLCLFTDASSTHWAGVLTQVSPSDVFNSTSEPQEWEHEPVAFVSGSFKGSSARWSTPEQECYAIIASVTRLCHILAACTEFSLFTDHKNILYMLSPSRFDTNVARHIVHKTQRWALRLAEFSYTVEHIPGESNLWADMLTRWASQDNENHPARRMAPLRVPLITEDLPDLPSVASIAQSQSNVPPQTGFSLRNMSGTDVWVNNEGKLYIPPEDTEMQLRICVAAHCGLGGHRGKTATKSIAKEKVVWPTLDADLDSFCQSCLVCLISATGEKVPRPFGQQEHAERVGELLHFDFLYIGESAAGPEYILILKDDFSGYVFLRPCEKADARSTANVLVEYFTTFVPVLKWFSDQGPHFCNEVMQLLATTLGVRHRFSTVYAPWTNGTVEAVCKEVLRVLHAVSTELQVPETEWPSVVPAIQSIINNSPSRRLGGRCPIKVHTGMDSGNPLSVALTVAQDKDIPSLDEARVMQDLRIAEAQQVLDDMHREVQSSLETTRKDAIDRHNRKTYVRPYNPQIGDYVLVARMHGPRTKMSANWVGPRRISLVRNDFTVEVEHLLTGKKEVVHICRVKHYVDKDLGNTVQMTEIAEFTDRIWHSVNTIKDLRTHDGTFEVLVSWKGLAASGDTWEPISIMFEDTPSKIRDFFSKKRTSRLLQQAKNSIGL